MVFELKSTHEGLGTPFFSQDVSALNLDIGAEVFDEMVFEVFIIAKGLITRHLHVLARQAV
jgi:hypothetical protein